MLAQAWKSYRARNYGIAYQQCRKVQGNYGQSSEYHHLMALILYHMREPLLAQNHFDVSLYLQPENVQCMCDYVEYLLWADQPVKAQMWIRRCIETGTKKKRAYYLMAMCHIALNDLPNGHINLKRCLELYPTSKSSKREMTKLEKRMTRLENLKTLKINELCQRVQELEVSCEKLSEKESQPKCVVCLQKERNHVNIICGHCSVCKECSRRISTCPLCRKMARFIRVFM